ncbi:hypothetical protein PSCLAVI8L_130532 [Pseudoclavibacter sp. 8L]|nr:hypothetical protein PSCLAVI8L_130532 [Pseudoclavibacter sp. 8L]
MQHDLLDPIRRHDVVVRQHLPLHPARQNFPPPVIVRPRHQRGREEPHPHRHRRHPRIAEERGLHRPLPPHLHMPAFPSRSSR